MCYKSTHPIRGSLIFGVIMKKMFIQTSYFLLFSFLVFESMAQNPQFILNDKHHIDSEACQVEVLKKKGFDFFAVRDLIIDAYMLNGVAVISSVLDQVKSQNRHVEFYAATGGRTEGVIKLSVSFALYEDSLPKGIVYNILYLENRGKDDDTNTTDFDKQSSCQISN